eukprot:scaffold2765_cov165-Amphora_coffeaeformis.AAC.16
MQTDTVPQGYMMVGGAASAAGPTGGTLLLTERYSQKTTPRRASHETIQRQTTYQPYPRQIMMQQPYLEVPHTTPQRYSHETIQRQTTQQPYPRQMMQQPYPEVPHAPVRTPHRPPTVGTPFHTPRAPFSNMEPESPYITYVESENTFDDKCLEVLHANVAQRETILQQIHESEGILKNMRQNRYERMTLMKIRAYDSAYEYESQYPHGGARLFPRETLPTVRENHDFQPRVPQVQLTGIKDSFDDEPPKKKARIPKHIIKLLRHDKKSPPPGRTFGFGHESPIAHGITNKHLFISTSDGTLIAIDIISAESKILEGPLNVIQFTTSCKYAFAVTRDKSLYMIDEELKCNIYLESCSVKRANVCGESFLAVQLQAPNNGAFEYRFAKLNEGCPPTDYMEWTVLQIPNTQVKLGGAIHDYCCTEDTFIALFKNNGQSEGGRSQVGCVAMEEGNEIAKGTCLSYFKQKSIMLDALAVGSKRAIVLDENKKYLYHWLHRVKRRHITKTELTLVTGENLQFNFIYSNSGSIFSVNRTGNELYKLDEESCKWSLLHKANGHIIDISAGVDFCAITSVEDEESEDAETLVSLSGPERETHDSLQDSFQDTMMKQPKKSNNHPEALSVTVVSSVNHANEPEPETQRERTRRLKTEWQQRDSKAKKQEALKKLERRRAQVRKSTAKGRAAKKAAKKAADVPAVTFDLHSHGAGAVGLPSESTTNRAVPLAPPVIHPPPDQPSVVPCDNPVINAGLIAQQAVAFRARKLARTEADRRATEADNSQDECDAVGE